VGAGYQPSGTLRSYLSATVPENVEHRGSFVYISPRSPFNVELCGKSCRYGFMKTIKALVLAAMVVPNPSFAFDIYRNYELNPGQFQDLETVCFAAFIEKIVPKFEGLEAARVRAPFFSIGLRDRASLVTYAEVDFQSEFGDATGAINCVFEGDTPRIWTVSAVFQGKGLAGYKKHPLALSINNPAEQWTQGLSSEILP